MARPRSLYFDVSERDWQQQILDCLHLHGWSAAHFRPAQTQSGRWSTPVQADGAGFPDLICVHPRGGDMLVAELKSEQGRLSPEQAQWLAFFETAGVDAFCWRPSDIDQAICRIAAPQRRVRRPAG